MVGSERGLGAAAGEAGGSSNWPQARGTKSGLDKAPASARAQRTRFHGTNMTATPGVGDGLCLWYYRRKFARLAARQKKMDGADALPFPSFEFAVTAESIAVGGGREADAQFSGCWEHPAT